VLNRRAGPGHPRTPIPDGSLVLGSPAKVARPLTEQEKEKLKLSAEKYSETPPTALRHGINVATALNR